MKEENNNPINPIGFFSLGLRTSDFFVAIAKEIEKSDKLEEEKECFRATLKQLESYLR